MSLNTTNFKSHFKSDTISIKRHPETGDPITNTSGLYYSLLNQPKTENISFCDFLKQRELVNKS